MNHPDAGTMIQNYRMMDWIWPSTAYELLHFALAVSVLQDC